MENLNLMIKQHYDIAVIAALVAIFVAGMYFKKGKIFSIVILISALYTLFTAANYNKIKKINFDDFKNKLKQKVIHKLDS